MVGIKGNNLHVSLDVCVLANESRKNEQIRGSNLSEVLRSPKAEAKRLLEVTG